MKENREIDRETCLDTIEMLRQMDKEKERAAKIAHIERGE